MGTKRRLDAWMINRECEGGGDFGFWELYALQTKILEDRTKDRSCLFEALFKGVSTGFGLLLDEKLFENTLQTACSTVQNLRLGGIKLQLETV